MSGIMVSMRISRRNITPFGVALYRNPLPASLAFGWKHKAVANLMVKLQQILTKDCRVSKPIKIVRATEVVSDEDINLY